MKKLYLSTILSPVLTVFSFIGCKQSNELIQRIDPTQSEQRTDVSCTRTANIHPDPTFEEAAAYLGQLGYDTSTLEERTTYFMIESDLMFPKTMLSELISRPLPYLVYGKLLDKAVCRLNIPVSTTEGIDFIKKVLEAWNSVGKCSMLDPEYSNNVNHYRVLYPNGKATIPPDFSGLY